MNREVRQMILGGSMLVVGWLVLLGIVVEVIPSHVVLSLAAYCLTLVGIYGRSHWCYRQDPRR